MFQGLVIINLRKLVRYNCGRCIVMSIDHHQRILDKSLRDRNMISMKLRSMLIFLRIVFSLFLKIAKLRKRRKFTDYLLKMNTNGVLNQIIKARIQKSNGWIQSQKFLTTIFKINLITFINFNYKKKQAQIVFSQTQIINFSKF